MTPYLSGLILALASAAAWGGADFSGGRATRRNHQFQVVAISSLVGVFVLLPPAALSGEPFPSLRTFVVAITAGIFGALGIAALYHGLSKERAALVAPTAGVVGVSVPVAFSMITANPPPVVQQIGLVTAVIGVAVVSSAPRGGQRASHRGLGTAIFAGLAFGAFFTLLAQIETGSLLVPLAIAKGAALLVAVPAIWIARVPLPSLTENRAALLAGVLDAVGNVVFVLATRLVRLDVAAVLGSLYPAVTVLLAWVIAKERMTARQWVGFALCTVAILWIAGGG